MVWGSGVLAVACLAVGVLHVVRLVVVRRDVVGEASHVAMALGMAAMASPLGNPVPEPVWTMVFVVIATWFALLVVRSGGLGGERGHHVVGSVAMLFMLAVEHGSASSAGGHMAGMGGASHGSGSVVVIASAIAIALAGYFGWHTLRCADRCRRTDCAEQPPSVTIGNATSDASVAVRPGWSLRTPQTAAAGHLVLAVSMSAMLLTMV
jgi:Domain of unknown function (DUF5134)